MFLVHETTIREMTNLFHNYQKLDEAGLLAALQSMVIYMILILCPIKDKDAVSVVDMAILVNLQQLINYVCEVGLSFKEERNHTRPSWEAWISMASRRRAVCSLYLIHWSVSAYFGLPSFDCADLNMFAPASKVLWLATEEKQWEAHYNYWLAKWEGQEILQGELCNMTPGVSMDQRAEKWLVETDELGILLMSLVNASR